MSHNLHIRAEELRTIPSYLIEPFKSNKKKADNIPRKKNALPIPLSRLDLNHWDLYWLLWVSLLLCGKGKQTMLTTLELLSEFSEGSLILEAYYTAQ